MNFKKWFTFSFILLLSLVILVACGGGGEDDTTAGDDTDSSESTESAENGDSDASGDTLKIGVVTTLSGPYGEIGKEMVDGIEIAVDEVNEQDGILGKQIELVIEDDEGEPDVAIRKAEKMALDDGIELFFGSVASGVTLALSEKMIEWDTMLITTTPKSMELTESDSNKNFFRINHNDNQDVLAIEHWMNNADLPYDDFYFVGADYEWGHDLLSEMTTIVEGIGGEILGEEYTPLGNTDFSTVLTNARSKNPDVILAAYAGGDGVNFLSQVDSFGIVDEDIDIIIVPMGDSLATTNPELTSGVYGPVNYHYSQDFENNVSFVEKFEATHDYMPTNFSGESYAGVEMLIQAIEEANSSDPLEVIQTLESDFTFESAMGELSVHPETHQVLHPNYIGEFYENSETGEADIQIVHSIDTEDVNPE